MVFTRDEYFMQLAVKEAEAAAKRGEIPVGAVIVRDGRVISAAGNRRERDLVATAHAELLAIESACEALGGWRLPDCELYVTLEPCPMCMGAIVNARIPRVIYGATDRKAGAAGGLFDMNIYPLNHHPIIVSGVLQEKCSLMLKRFFKSRRAGNGFDPSRKWREKGRCSELLAESKAKL